MSEWQAAVSNTVRQLRRNGFAGAAIALLILAIAPPTAGAEGFSGPFAWWLLLSFCLLPLAVSVHLLFDAALFRLAASHEDDATGLAAVDDVLARMGLRAPETLLRTLPERLAGCRRLLRLQRVSLGIAGLLYVILFVDMIAGGGAG